MGLQAIIVLGQASNGEKLSNLCNQRLKTASKLYFVKKMPIILSGGYSLKSKKDVGLSEAKLMKKMVLDLGINEKDIILEEKSRDTQGNAYFTKQIVKQRGWSKVLVVTSDFHLIKTKFFFNFVYGPKFKINYENVKTKFPEKKYKEIKEKEKKSINIMVKIYEEKKIKPGEDKKVIEILRPFYAKYG